ncbi:MAG: M24 family metallopeptidase [Bacteriovoracaceae bacterium]|nr:M24 family metallopeptidase [Bacteriovoracaceae bacterium]
MGVKTKNIDIATNIKLLRSFLKEKKLDAFFINDTDMYLNEYVPLESTHYHLLTGFTGTTAKVLIHTDGKIYLFVDGRYHEQADLETDPDLVQVEKCPQTKTTLGFVFERMEQLGIKNLGVDGLRTQRSLEKKLEEKCTIKYFDDNELQKIIPLAKTGDLAPVKHLGEKICGKSTREKVCELLQEGEAYYVCALDSIAWLTNARGFHLPYQSTFLSKCFVTRDKLYLFNLESSHMQHDIRDDFISVEDVGPDVFNRHLVGIKNKSAPKKVFFDSGAISGAEYRIIEDVFGKEALEDHDDGICSFQSLKNPVELEIMEKSFLRSNLAIAKTIRWIKESIKKGDKISEFDFYEKANDFYKMEGAVCQSFHTIAAVGANSSIIHWTSSSKDVVIQDGDMLLLDSGAHYEEGYSTDATRGFLSGGNPEDKQIEIYTIALKGILNAQTAVFPEGSLGCAIDILARTPINKAGYNYNHGTGHGIGINVHEGGAGFTYRNVSPIKPGQVVSIEPGIYVPGYGGVRHENIVVVENHPSMEGMLCFKNLVYVGFDEELIDRSMLSKEECEIFDDYQAECKKRGTNIN